MLQGSSRARSGATHDLLRATEARTQTGDELVRRTLIPLLAGVVQCQPATPPRALTPPPPEAGAPTPLPAPVPAPEAGAPSTKPAPDPVAELYRALSTKRHHSIVRVGTTRVCLRFTFEALAERGSRAHDVLWLSSASDSWKLEFELSGATLAMKRASTQLPPQGVQVMMCNDQLVLGGTPERPTLNDAPVFDDLETCKQALGRDPALNEAPLVFDPEPGFHCISNVAEELSRPERSRR
jgi:hypothetical protein